MMRLNCVESFYAFLLRFRREGSEEGQPATASPHVGPATHSQADCKGQPVVTKSPCKGGGRPPTGMAGACGHRQRPRPGRKGQLPAARP
ncbi:hypothetical protein BHM03_00022721 [Ensete ventricosum]|nr:hypothetical protein BHM03_00022721 [Ensete ventricosum]